MKLVRVADCISDIFYGQFCGDQELYCLAHPEIYQEFLRADSKILPEDLPKIIAVDLTGIRDICDGNIRMEILINVGHCPFEIIPAHSLSLGRSFGR